MWKVKIRIQILVLLAINNLNRNKHYIGIILRITADITFCC